MAKKPTWLLALSCHASIGAFFAYETAGALAPQLKSELGFDSTQIGLMYSAWSIPGVLTILIGGALADKWGAAKTLVLSSVISAVGTIIVALSTTFWPMFFGVIIFGVGGNTCFSTTSTLMGSWFVGDPQIAKKLAIGHGLTKMWLRAGSFAAFIILPILGTQVNLKVALWFPALVSISGAVAAIIFLLCTRNLDKKPGNEKYVQLEAMLPEGESEGENETEGESDGASKAGQEGLSMSVSADENSEANESLISSKAKSDDESGGKSTNTKKGKDGILTKISTGLLNYLQQFKEYPRSYWVIFVLVAVFVNDLYNFTAFLTDIAFEDFHYTREAAGMVTSLVCLANLVTAPFSGLLFGYIGKRTYAIIGGSLMILFVQTVFAFTTKVPPAILAIMLGLTQSVLDTTLWPSLPLILDAKYLGMGYAFNQVCYNIIGMLFPAVAGAVKDHYGGWHAVHYMFIFLGLVSTICSFVLKYINKVDNGPLDLKVSQTRTTTVAVGGH